MRIIHVHEDIKIIRLRDRWVIINKGVVIWSFYTCTAAKEMFNEMVNQAEPYGSHWRKYNG